MIIYFNHSNRQRVSVDSASLYDTHDDGGCSLWREERKKLRDWLADRSGASTHGNMHECAVRSRNTEMRKHKHAIRTSIRSRLFKDYRAATDQTNCSELSLALQPGRHTAYRIDISSSILHHTMSRALCGVW